MIPATQVCAKCLKPKDQMHFTRTQASKTGLHPYCRQCVRDKHLEQKKQR